MLTEQLDPVVAAIGNVYIAVLVDGDAGRSAQLAKGVAGRAELRHVLAILREPLHPVVSPVCNDNRAVVGVDVDAPGHVELAVATAFFAERGDRHSFGGELLNAVVQGVDYEQVAIGVENDSGRPVQFAIARALLAPRVNFRAVFGPEADLVTAFVRDDQRIVGPGDHLHRPYEVASDFTQVFVVPVGEPDLAASIENVEVAIVSDYDVRWSRGHTSHAERAVKRECGPEESMWFRHVFSLLFGIFSRRGRLLRIRPLSSCTG